MVAFLPSEVARLVLGYLKSVECVDAYLEFLNKCRHLEECRGREFFTTIMGMTLMDILDDYCSVHSTGHSNISYTQWPNVVSSCQRQASCRVGDVTDLSSTNHTSLKDHSLGLSMKEALKRQKKIDIAKRLLIKSVHKFKCDHPLQQKLSKCFSLNDKVTLLLERLNSDREYDCSSKSSTDSSSTRNSRHISNKSQIVKNATKSSMSPNVFETSTVRHKKDFKKGFISDNPTIHSTSLSDLPGLKCDSNKSKEWKNQDQVDVNVENKDALKKSTYYSPIDRINSGIQHTTPDRNEEDFRNALGLIKNSDFMGVCNKVTPIKRKGLKPKISSSSLKKSGLAVDNHNNESLDVTTITNAMLDLTELHETIANNINLVINSSNNKSDFIMDCERNEKVKTPFKETLFSDVVEEDSQQLDNVIKAIVEKTEKDPLFVQLLDEVYAASIENAIGSDSDGLSRPETSTPEKSCRSTSNVGSPESCNTNDTELFTQFNLKTSQSKLFDPKSDHEAPVDKCRNDSKSSIDDFKRYPRRPRGGKKMDLLRENYKSFHFDESNDTLLPEQLNNIEKSITNQELPQPSSNQKVVILSNEPVHTNLTSIMSFNEEVQLKIEHNKLTYENDSEKTLSIDENIEMKNETNLVGNRDQKDFEKSIGKFKKLQLSDGKLITHNENGIEKTNDIAVISERDSLKQVSSEIILNSKINHGNIGNLVNLTIPTNTMNVQNYTSGKPPEILISKNQFNLKNSRDINKTFTEAEIMKMPTIIMFKATDGETDVTELRTHPWNPFSSNEEHKSSIATTDKKVNIKKSPKKHATHNFIPIMPKVKSLKDIDAIIGGESYQTKDNSIVMLEPMKIQIISKNNGISSDIHDNVNSDSLEILSNKVTSDSGNISLSIEESTDKIQFEKCTDFPMTTEDKPTSPDSSCILLENESKVKTPRRSITQKLCSSTPTKKISHVRILDFNTPCNPVSTKKSLTSPKLLRKNFKLSRKPSFKSRLFSPIKEVNAQKLDAIDLTGDSENHAAINDDSNLLLQDNLKNEILLHKKIVNVPEKINKIETLPENSVKKNAWDHHLRTLAVSGNPVNEGKKRKNTKHKKIKKNLPSCKTNLSTSIEIEGKLLENALLDKSFDSTSEQKLNSFAIKKKSKRLKNNSGKNTEDNIPENISKESRSKSKQKKPLKAKASVLKVKIGSKNYSDNISKKSVIDDSTYSVSESKNLTQTKSGEKSNVETHHSNIIESQKTTTANNLKLNLFGEDSESDIHITPEFPKEIRVHPTNVRCNLSSLLETPFKSHLLDVTMNTPKFLSPGDSEPVSIIKMLGMPTPNFDTPFINSELKASESEYTPGSQSSKQTGYASSGSYYKPDEINLKMLKSNNSPDKKCIEKCNDTENEKNKAKSKKNLDTDKGKSKKCRNNSSISTKSKTVHHEKPTKKPQPQNLNLNTSSSMVLRPREIKNRWKSLKRSPNKGNKLSEKIVSRTSVDFSSAQSKKSTTLPSLQCNESFSKSCVDKSDKIHERNLLEEKRQRVISKFNAEKKKSPKKKSVTLIDKVAKLKESRRLSLSRKIAAKNDGNEKKFTKVFPHISINQEAGVLLQESKNLRLTPLSKSRRKSSTPRKLEKVESGEVIDLNKNDELDIDHAKSLFLDHKKVKESELKNLNRVDALQSHEKHFFVDEHANELVSRECKVDKLASSLEDTKEHSVGYNDSKYSEKSESEASKTTLSKEQLPSVPKDDIIAIESGTNDLESVEKSNASLNSEIDYENNGEDIIVWYNIDCHNASPNYFNLQYNPDYKIRKKNSGKQSNTVDNFVLNANIYNSVKNAEEIRIIKASEFKPLIDISPTFKSRVKSTDKYDIKEDDETLQTNSKNHSSKSPKYKKKYLSEDEDVHDTIISAVDNPKDTESKMVKTKVPKEKSNKETGVPSKEPTKTESISKIAADKEIDKNVVYEVDDDLMTFAVTESSHSVDKRKRDSCDDPVDYGTKKMKSVISQQLLKEMDIEEILSQLHPGKN